MCFDHKKHRTSIRACTIASKCLKIGFYRSKNRRYPETMRTIWNFATLCVYACPNNNLNSRVDRHLQTKTRTVQIKRLFKSKCSKIRIFWFHQYCILLCKLISFPARTGIITLKTGFSCGEYVCIRFSTCRNYLSTIRSPRTHENTHHTPEISIKSIYR